MRSVTFELLFKYERGLIVCRAVTVSVTTASLAVVVCHRGCLLPPAIANCFI